MSTQPEESPKQPKPEKAPKAGKPDKTAKPAAAKKEEPAEPAVRIKPALKQHYEQVVVPELKKKFGFDNIHQVPAIQKIVINHGFNAQVDKAGIEEAVKEIGQIAGQKAVIALSRVNISNFKLREGVPIGVKVTLRGANMYDFLYRLLAVALPGIRDFRGVSAKLDGHGNYTLGITDHTIFPESHGDHSRRAIGMDICIVTSAGNDEQGRELLRLMGMPFRKRSGETTTKGPVPETAAVA